MTDRGSTPEKKRKRRFGDRYDGRKLRSLEPINGLMPFVMSRRNDSANYFRGRVYIREAERYIRQKRVDGLKGFGMLHFFIVLTVRIISQRPALNRFVAGQRMYARNNIEFLLVVKKELTVSGQETIIKVTCQPDDTAADVYHRVMACIEEARGEGDSNDFDRAARILNRFPRVFMRLMVALLRALDYYGMFPKFLHKVSPFHGSMFITDLGSIGLAPVHHHLYEFGNCSMFLSFGAKEKTYEMDRKGEMKEHRSIQYVYTLDERICDGFYFAGVLRMVKDIFSKPEQLDSPPEKIVEDVD